MTRRLSEWQLSYEEWDPDEQPLRETLLTLGNGHFCTRGALEEERASKVHYPGTYLAGGYNRMTTEVDGRDVENEDLVNWPNWLPITFRCEGGAWFGLDSVTVEEHSQRLDLRKGVLYRHVRFADPEGRTFELDSRRLVSMAHVHLAAIEWRLRPLDWSGRIEVRSSIDGSVTNTGVARYRDLEGNHLQVERTGGEDEVMHLVSRTRQSHIRVAQAVRTRLVEGAAAELDRRTSRSEVGVHQLVSLRCEAGCSVTITKTVALYSSRDPAISEPLLDATQHARRAPGFDALLEAHAGAWARLWRRIDLQMQGCDTYAQLVLRLHLFHLIQTTSPHTIERDVGIPARGWHGEAYRGHIFWDELFAFPLLNWRIPEITRSLLLYRYRRLDRARMAARQLGYRGAMFPWQSGSNGREESQRVHKNPESGRWIPDNTHRQRHVGSAIAWNVWQYFQATGDMEFMSSYGAEIILEIARFWASIADLDEERGRWVIRGVVGPDEFHTRYPGTDSEGLDNNAYTNVMAAWVLETARQVLERLPEQRRVELRQSLEISEQEWEHWHDVSQGLFVPMDEHGIIQQFEGWGDLEELDWDRLRREHGDIHRLDRILEAADDDPNRYKANKQADVLMLFYLFSSEELVALFDRLGYDFPAERIPDNIDYYLERTSHGSSLSRVVHAWVLARSHRESSWPLFRDALASDIDDLQGGTTPEGIHVGAMAGTVDLVQRCYAGIEMRDDVIWLNPRLPEKLRCLSLTVRYRGHWLDVTVTQRTLTVTFEKGWSKEASVGFSGRVYSMTQGQQLCFDLASEALKSA